MFLACVIVRVHIIWFGSLYDSTCCCACSHVVGICADTCERTMPPKTPITNSVYELRDRVQGLQSEVDRLKTRMREFEMPADTFEAEIVRLRKNCERSLAEMRELKDQVSQLKKKAKRQRPAETMAKPAQNSETGRDQQRPAQNQHKTAKPAETSRDQHKCIDFPRKYSFGSGSQSIWEILISEIICSLVSLGSQWLLQQGIDQASDPRL